MELTESQRGACAAIIHAPEAWSRWEDVEAAHGGETLDALVLAGVVVPWVRSDYVAVTLTPWGAWLLGVVIDEVWRAVTEETVKADETRPLAEPEVTTERVMTEVPRWAEGESDRPLRLPRHSRIGTSLAQPARVVAPPEAEPEFLRDEAGEVVTLFGGHPVRLERRRKARAG